MEYTITLAYATYYLYKPYLFSHAVGPYAD